MPVDWLLSPQNHRRRCHFGGHWSSPADSPPEYDHCIISLQLTGQSARNKQTDRKDKAANWGSTWQHRITGRKSGKEEGTAGVLEWVTWRVGSQIRGLRLIKNENKVAKTTTTASSTLIRLNCDCYWVLDTPWPTIDCRPGKRKLGRQPSGEIDFIYLTVNNVNAVITSSL